MENWTDEVNEILEKMRKNSIELSTRHRNNYYEYKGYSKWFDVPIIIISTISASLSITFSFLSEEVLAISNCSISMLVAILTSLKLYLQLEEAIKTELEMSKSFHSLALDIFKMLNLKIDQRGESGVDYLNKKYNTYVKLIENSALLRRNLKKDFLLEIDGRLISDDNSISSNENNETNFKRFNLEKIEEEKEYSDSV